MLFHNNCKKKEVERLCIRCNTPMTDTHRKVFVFNGNVVKALICPQCGEVGFYVANLKN